MAYGYDYNQLPIETFRQWCRRGALAKSDRIRVRAAGWFIFFTAAWSMVQVAFQTIDVVNNGYNSLLLAPLAPYRLTYLQAGFSESTLITLVVAVSIIATILSLAFSVLMGIFILRYSTGWAITYLVFESFAIFSALSSLAVFAVARSFSVLTLISIPFGIVGFVLAILAVTSLTRAKKQWQVQMQPPVQYPSYPSYPSQPSQPG